MASTRCLQHNRDATHVCPRCDTLHCPLCVADDARETTTAAAPAAASSSHLLPLRLGINIDGPPVGGADSTVGTFGLMPYRRAMDLAALLARSASENNELCIDGVLSERQRRDLDTKYVPRGLQSDARRWHATLDELDLTMVHANVASGAYGSVSELSDATRQFAMIVKRESIARYVSGHTESVAVRYNEQFVEQATMYRLGQFAHIYHRINGNDAWWPFPTLYATWSCNEWVYTLMQLMRGTTLASWLRGTGANDPAAVRSVVMGVHRACRMLDVRAIVHGDLHAGNVMVSGGDDGAPRVSIIDFGKSTTPFNVADGTNFAQFVFLTLAAAVWPTALAARLIALFDADDLFKYVGAQRAVTDAAKRAAKASSVFGAIVGRASIAPEHIAAQYAQGQQEFLSRGGTPQTTQMPERLADQTSGTASYYVPPKWTADAARAVASPEALEALLFS